MNAISGTYIKSVHTPHTQKENPIYILPPLLLGRDAWLSGIHIHCKRNGTFLVRPKGNV